MKSKAAVSVEIFHFAHVGVTFAVCLADLITRPMHTLSVQSAWGRWKINAWSAKVVFIISHNIQYCSLKECAALHELQATTEK